jgi:flagellar L-ring protein FlgH
VDTTKKILAALVLVGLSVFSVHAQAGSMFADPKAAAVGDAVTVLISENASATNQTSTSTEKSNQLQLGSNVPGAGNLLDFVPLHALESDYDNSFEGTASTSRSARLTARMTVSVIGQLPNGDLVLDGVRTLKINGETEAIHLSGSVSRALISANNTVSSSSISDLNIEYTGKGVMTQGSRPGIFVRFVNWLF